MRRFALTVLGLLLVVGAFVAPRLAARADSTAHFDYLHLRPGLPEFDVTTGQRTSPPRNGYTACVAKSPDAAKCREFADKESQDRALNVALGTLGSQGWELVSVIDETANQGSPKGLTYIFKRQVAQ